MANIIEMICAAIIQCNRTLKTHLGKHCFLISDLHYV